MSGGAVCPLPDNDACTDMGPCDVCVSLSKPLPVPPDDPWDDEEPGGPIYSSGGGA